MVDMPHAVDMLLKSHFFILQCMCVVIFYMLAPIPLALSRRCTSQDVMSQENLSIFSDVCYFLSACIVVSGFGKGSSYTYSVSAGSVLTNRF